MLREMEILDLGVVMNHIADQAAANGVVLPRKNILMNLEKILENAYAYVIEIDGKIVAATLWEESKVQPFLTVFYIVDEYKTNRKVITQMYRKVIEHFGTRRLWYTPLHENISNIKYCNDGIVDLAQAQKDLDRLERKYGRK